MALGPGIRLGPYELTGSLGAGGMGEVYRARDTRLGREVAIKIIGGADASDPDRRQRFQREARAIAALSHPHICTIHDVGSEAGVDYLVLELLQGESLASRLRRGPLSLDEALARGIEIAQALDRAHRAGIIHRDLKPGNVMLTPTGAKVLDFGLARIARGDTDTPIAPAGAITAPLTEAGAVLGTLPYMAPEQIEGRAADARTDVFAFGATLYEMLTGRRPFEASSAAGLSAAIVRGETPSPVAVQPHLPAALDAIVRSCLAKDPEHRLASLHDVAMALQWARDDTRVARAPVRAGGASRAWWTTAGAMVILLLGGAAGWMLSEPRQAPGVRLSNPRQLTFTIGVESLPSWSPDGGRIAYVSDQSGNNDIWVVPAAGGAARNFTDDPGNDSEPSWSPDGNQIAFVSDRDPNRGGIYVMPALGGRPERISPRGSAEAVSSPQWSANGTELAHMRREPEGNVIEIVSLATRQTRRVTVPGDQGNRFDLSWSRDGRYFAYVRAVESRRGNQPPLGAACR